MVFQLTTNERLIFEAVGAAAATTQTQAFVVGGWVRDRIMGRQKAGLDIDFVSTGDGIALAHATAELFSPCPRVVEYSRFGVAMFVWKGIDLEFVSARKESYRPDSRKPLVEQGTLIDDQLRRDFTINAMAMSLQKEDFGRLIDPFEGLSDIQNKILRTPTEAGKTFSDDPLRMVRAIRFATQLHFDIEPQTVSGISHYAERLEIVSRERICTELEKIMAADQPSIGFKWLFKTGLLRQILPELLALHGVEEKNGIKHKDNFYHTLQVLDNLCAKSDNIWLRWAALFHDIGKAPTKRFEKDIGWTFWNHENVGAAMVPRLFKNLGLPLDQRMKYVRNIVAHHQKPIHLTQVGVSDAAVRRLLVDLGDDIDDLMLLCESDITSRNEQKVKLYLQNYEILRQRLIEIEAQDQLRNWQPPITGELIMEVFGIKPSREVGHIKNAVREAILEGEIPNEYSAAYALMLHKGLELGLQPV